MLIEQSLDTSFLPKRLRAHLFIVAYLSRPGTPLEPLPFVGAIFVRGTSEKHSGMFHESLMNKLPKLLNIEMSHSSDMGVTEAPEATIKKAVYGITARVIEIGLLKRAANTPV